MDLVSNLILNSSQYTAGAQTAIGSNRALHGSIDSIIGQLQRQKRAFEQSNLTTRDNILASAAKPGVTEGQVNVALQLHEEVEAHKRAAAAAAEDAAQKRVLQEAKDAAARAGASLLDSLQTEIATFGMSANQLQLYRAEQAGVNAVVIDAARVLQEKRDALIADQQAQAAAEAVEERARANSQSVIAGLQQQKAEYGMTASQITLYRMAQEGATEAEIRHAQGVLKDIAAMDAKAKADAEAAATQERHRETVQSTISTLEREIATYGMTREQLQLYTAANANATESELARIRALQQEAKDLASLRAMQESINSSTARAAGATGNLSRSSMILTESIRSAEDAVAGFTNNGLKGMLQATTNNIGQIGALLGGTAGLALSIGSIGALIGVSLIPKMIEWATNTEEVKKKKEELAAASKKAFDQEMDQMLKLREQRYKDQVGEAAFARDKNKERDSEDLKAERERLQREKEELKQTQAQEALRQQRMLFQDPTINEGPKPFRNKPLRDFAGFIEDITPGSGGSADYGQETPEMRRVRKEEHEKREARKREFRESQEREAEAVRQMDIRNQRQKELDEEAAGQKVIEERKAQAERWSAEQEYNLKRKKQEEADLRERNQRIITEQKSLASSIESSIRLFAPSITEQDEIKRKQDEVEQARKNKLITDAEAATLNKMFGTRVEGAAPNAGATRFGSREDYSAIIRAMKDGENAKAEAERTKLATEANTILDKIRAYTETMAQQQLVVVTST